MSRESREHDVAAARLLLFGFHGLSPSLPAFFWLLRSTPGACWLRTVRRAARSRRCRRLWRRPGLQFRFGGPTEVRLEQAGQVRRDQIDTGRRWLRCRRRCWQRSVLLSTLHVVPNLTEDLKM